MRVGCSFVCPSCLCTVSGHGTSGSSALLCRPSKDLKDFSHPPHVTS